MKTTGKTLNAQRSTFNVQASRVGEDNATYDLKQSGVTKSATAGPKFDLKDRSLEFTASVIALVDGLPNLRAGNHIAGPLLRCGTSPFANHGEVQAAESRKDFVPKLGICFEELKEIKRWLCLLGRLDLAPLPELRSLLLKTEEPIRIFSASIRTVEKNSK